MADDRNGAAENRRGKRLGFALARAIVLSAVVVSPWLFGSAEPWAYLTICLLVGLGLAAWLISLIHDPQVRLRPVAPEAAGWDRDTRSNAELHDEGTHTGGLSRASRSNDRASRPPLLTAALLMLLAWVFIQTLPILRMPMRAVSPISVEAQFTRSQLFEKLGAEEFLPVDLSDTSDPSDRTDLKLLRAAISASAPATRRSFYLLAAYIGVFLVMANTLTEPSHVRGAAAAITVSSFLMAIFALTQKFSGTSDIYWFHTPRFGGNIFGPFTNKNHFAAHMSMAFGVAMGLLLVVSRSQARHTFETWRDRLVWLSTRKASRIALLWFAVALMGAAVCMTLSRGGIASLALSLGAVGIFVPLRASVLRRGRVLAAVALLVVATVVWLGWQPVFQRLRTLTDVAEDPTSHFRMVAALGTLEMFKRSPIVGCGFGSFQHVFPLFQSESIQIGRWLHAHNDYAQLLAEGGIVGASLIVLAGLSFVRILRRGLRSASSEGKLMIWGLAIGILAVALHSLVDYGLHKPSNALLFATLCGLSVATVHLRGPGKGSRRETLAFRRHENERKTEKQAQAAAEVS